MKKLNCLEYKKCGREPGGQDTGEFGICPASTEKRLHGVHGGINAGRACWVVAGTFCRGEVQGTFAKKYKNCEVCDFYRLVREEEKWSFEHSAVLLTRLQ